MKSAFHQQNLHFFISMKSCLLLFSIVIFASGWGCHAEASAPIAQGFIDTVEIQHGTMIAQGWAGTTDQNGKITSLSIKIGSVEVYDGSMHAYERPDVVRATGRLDWINSGWRVTASLPSNLRKGTYPVEARVRLETGESLCLANNSNSGKIAVGYSPAQIIIYSGICLLLLLLFVCGARLFVNKHPGSLSAAKQFLTKIFKTRWVNHTQFILLATALIVGTIFSGLIPPFQSPDEQQHLTRAYSLLKGKILLTEHRGQQDSGVMIDEGLLKYMDSYIYLRFHPAAKITDKEEYDSKNISWSSNDAFSSARGAAAYFPIAYFPQAAGLWVGKTFSLSIDTAYRLTRFFVLLASLLTLFVSFKTFPPNFFVLTLLLLPMTIFQMISTSLDAFSNALAVLCISLFMRGVNTQYAFPKWMCILLSLLILVTASCRAQLLPFVLFPLVIFFIRKKRWHLFSFFWVSACCLLWVIISNKMTHSPTRVDSSIMIKYYITHLPELLFILKKTVDENFRNYFAAFVGILGWLDTRFALWFYSVSAIFLAVTASLSASFKTIRNDYISRLTLIFVSFSSIFLVFFALLTTWTLPSEPTIQGVQGRYFLIPIILLGYSLSGAQDVTKMRRTILAYPFLTGWVLLSSYCMARLLITRYYMHS